MTANVAIIDYGSGNLFSIAHACKLVGLTPKLIIEDKPLDQMEALILPGVGAFESAMQALHSRGLIDPILNFAASGRAVMGVCLGMQLLFSQSREFGVHDGLGLIEGQVEKLTPNDSDPYETKVPHVGWSAVRPPSDTCDWDASLLAPLEPGVHQYFVHSYVVKPKNDKTVLAVSRYGGVEFCTAVRVDNVQGFQFHPERSGPDGLRIYQALADSLQIQ